MHRMCSSMRSSSTCGRRAAGHRWLQARNDARVVVAGSLDMFSNRFLQAAVDTAAAGHRRDPLPGLRDAQQRLASGKHSCGA